jgi:transcriptional regulator with AAA-type ATPase domain
VTGNSQTQDRVETNDAAGRRHSFDPRTMQCPEEGPHEVFPGKLIEHALNLDPGEMRPPTQERLATDRVIISVVDGPDRGTTFEKSGADVTVGTSSDNDLVLTDPTVGAHHARLRSSAKGIIFRDLGSRSGTFLGGMRIHEAVVPAATRLRVGDTVLACFDSGAAALSPGELAAGIPGLVATSPAMREVVTAVRKLARTSISVLIQGETGTGKELVAQAIHDLGPRAKRPYVIVDVGALSPTLVASQLFGHERGAFTGADQRHEGAFERADGGSILLDEIGELPLLVQPALLGVLERRSFRRLGGRDQISVDVRVICATHRDLREAVRQGTFREDLYFRLAAGRLRVPTLRERPQDIEPLVEHFAREISGAARAPFSDALMTALQLHRWPGNVRELRNVVESALTGERVTLDGFTLPEGEAPLLDSAGNELVTPYRNARDAAVSAFERAYLVRLVDSAGGNMAAAARMARMDRSYLLSLMRKCRLR